MIIRLGCLDVGHWLSLLHPAFDQFVKRIKSYCAAKPNNVDNSIIIADEHSRIHLEGMVRSEVSLSSCTATSSAQLGTTEIVREVTRTSDLTSVLTTYCPYTVGSRKPRELCSCGFLHTSNATSARSPRTESWGDLRTASCRNT